MPTVSHAMTDALAAEGVRFLFGVPGGENIHFMEDARQRGIRYVLTKREGSAAFMADMIGQITGTPGVVLSTLGPGSTNLPNGVANALLDRSPMLAITAQTHRHRIGTWTHQYVDHKRLFAPISKASFAVEPESATRVMRRALRTAVAPRPGPVHLDLSSDVARAETRSDSRDGILPGAPGARRSNQGGADPHGLEQAMRMLGQSQRPVVVAGLSAARSNASEALVAFAEATRTAVVTTAKAKGVMPEDHPLFAGVIDMAAPDVVADVLHRADLVLAIGFDPVELIKDWTFAAPTIHIDDVPNTDQVYPAELELVGNVASITQELTSIKAGASQWTTSELDAYRVAIRRKIVDDSTSVGLAPHRVVLACREAMPDDAIVTVDVGSHKMLVGQLWQARLPNTLFQSNGLSAMGFAFPGALAAQLAQPERKVLCLTGDGGFSMSLSELELAVLNELPVITVVFSDGSLNRIELKQEAAAMPSTGTRTMRYHFAKVAEAYGATGLVADDAASFDRALATALDTPGPVVIEANVDPSEYAGQF